jgi:glutamate-1-semialdehyde 2,1-aminomutase
MYAILLSRAFTGRDMVMKVGGGWHGAQPWALKGIGYHAGAGNGFQKVESEGVPASVTDQVIVTNFNDPDGLRDHFRVYGDQVACFILEPFLGVGGYVPATREYLQTARELTHQYGALLVFDEVISGFRFRAGSVSALYGVQPDLASFGGPGGTLRRQQGQVLRGHLFCPSCLAARGQNAYVPFGRARGTGLPLPG